MTHPAQYRFCSRILFIYIQLSQTIVQPCLQTKGNMLFVCIRPSPQFSQLFAPHCFVYFPNSPLNSSHLIVRFQYCRAEFWCFSVQSQPLTSSKSVHVESDGILFLSLAEFSLSSTPFFFSDSSKTISGKLQVSLSSYSGSRLAPSHFYFKVLQIQI